MIVLAEINWQNARYRLAGGGRPSSPHWIHCVGIVVECSLESWQRYDNGRALEGLAFDADRSAVARHNAVNDA